MLSTVLRSSSKLSLFLELTILFASRDGTGGAMLLPLAREPLALDMVSTHIKFMQEAKLASL